MTDELVWRPHARSINGESRRTLSEPFSPFESKHV